MRNSPSGLRYCSMSRLLELASRQPRLLERTLSLALALEGGQLYSGSAREIFRRRFGVTIGAYTYGSCFTSGRFQPNTVIGRYVSIAPGVRGYLRDHPTQTLSTHPFFFNSGLGLVEKDTMPQGRLVIGHDAWIGSNVVVTPGCKRIGIGAIVAAGSVVTRNVADFAVVGGVPAEILRYRFPRELKREILASKWWELTPPQLGSLLSSLITPLSDDPSVYQPLLRGIRSLPRSEADENADADFDGGLTRAVRSS